MILAKDADGVTEELVELEADPGAGESHQAKDESELWTPTDTLTPPEDLIMLKRLSEHSQIRDTSINAVVVNTVGLGWDIDRWPYREADVSDDDIREARERIDVIARRDRRLGRPSFTTLMRAVKRDQKEIGNGFLEVSRNRRSGQVDGLYHVPGERVRRKRDQAGWVMGQNPDVFSGEGDPIRVDFYNFGEKVSYSEAGEPQPRLASGLGQRRWKVNELIHFREYTSQDRDYGLPRDAALAVEYVASRYVNEWTASFFAASGVPPKMVFVQGEEARAGETNRVRFTVPQKTVNRIDQALHADAKPGSRVVVIPVPPGTKIDEVTLGELSDRDLTFGEFKSMHRQHVGSAHGLLPLFYGDVADSGRYTAEVQRALTLEQTFDPDQVETEDRLWTTLMSDMGMGDMRIKFKRLAVEGNAVRRQSANDGAEVGAVTMGEWRDAHGLGPLPWDGPKEEDPNDRILNTGLPRGAQNRERIEDQRGLRPGIGGRESHAKDNGHPDFVEAEVDALAKELSEYGPVAPR